MNWSEFEKKIAEEAVKSTCILPDPLKTKIREACNTSSGLEKKFFERITENLDISETRDVPACQDTGIFEMWIKIGDRIDISGGNIGETAVRAIKKAHENGFFRKSMDPVEPVVHISFIKDNHIDVVVTPRGFGSENYSFLHMMNPESDFTAIKNQVIEDVKTAGGRPCPPYLIGIGIGGTASKAVEMSTEALTEIDFINPDKEESEILADINKLGIGAGGMGGDFTALAVKIKKFPQHIAGLALAVHIGCWCNRVRKFRFETS
jgi:fumarate hydratase subunit alpha